MSEPWGVVFSALIVTVGGLITYYFSRRKNQADTAAAIVTAAGEMVDNLKQELDRANLKIEKLETRIVVLETHQEAMEKKYKEVREGASRLHGQVVSMGGIPVYVPPQ